MSTSIIVSVACLTAHSSRSERCRQHIELNDGLLKGLARGHVAFPMNDEGNTDTAFISLPLRAAQ